MKINYPKDRRSRGPQSAETKHKISQALSGRRAFGQQRRLKTAACASCSTVFTKALRKYSKYCSDSCRPKIKTGGLRRGAGRGKSGYFRGHFCDSSYELAWLAWKLDTGEEIERCKEGIVYAESRTYYPDFKNLRSGKVTEIKGFLTPTVEAKWQAAVSAGLDYEILFKKDLEPAFKHVEQVYGLKAGEVTRLYTDFKGTELVCDSCSVSFTRTRRVRLDRPKFCSQRCAGLNQKKSMMAKRRGRDPHP